MGYEIFTKKYGEHQVVIEFGFDDDIPLNFNVWVEREVADFGNVGENIADLICLLQSDYSNMFNAMNKALNTAYADMGLVSNDFNGFQFGFKNDRSKPQLIEDAYIMWSTVNDNVIENDVQLEKIKSKLEWNDYESFVS